jgi:ubiquinone biosynthesis protein
MHPGNIFVLIDDPRRPRYAAVDFGIVGSLDPRDQHYLAQNFLAVFDRDYKRVAQLHLESGWVPPGTRIDEMESAVRTVCEPIFDRPLKDISFGRILLRLFEISRRFNMQVQPQLILLQKTLLNVEGLGRDLYPELDIWNTASPILREWMRERTSLRAFVREIRAHAPQLLEAAHGVPTLLRALARRAESPPATTAHELRTLQLQLQAASRRRDALVLGSALLFGGLVWLAAARPPLWLGWLLLAAGLAKIAYGLSRGS